MFTVSKILLTYESNVLRRTVYFKIINFAVFWIVIKSSHKLDISCIGLCCFLVLRPCFSKTVCIYTRTLHTTKTRVPSPVSHATGHLTKSGYAQLTHQQQGFISTFFAVRSFSTKKSVQNPTKRPLTTELTCFSIDFKKAALVLEQLKHVVSVARVPVAI